MKVQKNFRQILVFTTVTSNSPNFWPAKFSRYTVDCNIPPVNNTMAAIPPTCGLLWYSICYAFFCSQGCSTSMAGTSSTEIWSQAMVWNLHLFTNTLQYTYSGGTFSCAM